MQVLWTLHEISTWTRSVTQLFLTIPISSLLLKALNTMNWAI